MDVAIVGVGLHPFGRFGDRTGIDMGAIAIRRALADAGVEWRDIRDSGCAVELRVADPRLARHLPIARLVVSILSV